MANKTLGTRQKLIFRIPLAARSVKPRNPIALAAKQRVAGAHQKSASAQQRSLKKRIAEPENE